MEDLKEAIAAKSEWVVDSLAPREVVRGFVFFFFNESHCCRSL